MPDLEAIALGDGQSLLRAMAQAAVADEIDRLFPAGIDVAAGDWIGGPGMTDPPSTDHPAAGVAGSANVFPVLWGGVVDAIARTNPRMSVARVSPKR